jgi:hypothetical protein
MAITVASSSKGEYDSSPPCVVTAPTGIQVGDLLVCFAGGKQNDPTFLSITDFTYLDGITTGGESLVVLYKVAVTADTTASDYSVASSDAEVTGAVMLRITGWSTNDTLTNKATQSVSNGVFTTLDLTPTVANSLILFAAFEYTAAGGAIGGYAIATNNPSWTEAQEVAPAFSIGGLGVAYAVRPEITATGDFSITDTGSQLGISLVIAPIPFIPQVIII